MIMYCDICGAKIENGENVIKCPRCLCNIIGFKSPIPDGSWVKAVSKDDAFMNAMIELYKNNPIEYQLKIQQFKIQVQQQEQLKPAEQTNNIPHCPTCSSTDIKKISGLSKAGSVAMWGLLSRRVHKQWHCNNCGSEW